MFWKHFISFDITMDIDVYCILCMSIGCTSPSDCVFCDCLHEFRLCVFRRVYLSFRLCILQLQVSLWILSVFSGSISPSDFVTTTMSVLEGISQHPQLVAEFHQVVLESILPIIADLVVSQNGKTSEIEKVFGYYFNLI